MFYLENDLKTTQTSIRFFEKSKNIGEGAPTDDHVEQMKAASDP